jgi:hypothetical protein
VHGAQAKFAKDPHWKDLILFYEYFHGDNGAGLGASHQTGWTGLSAVTATLFHTLGDGEWSARGRESLRPTGDREDRCHDRLAQHPVIYEINTLIWLGELSRRYGHPVTLGEYLRPPGTRSRPRASTPSG